MLGVFYSISLYSRALPLSPSVSLFPFSPFSLFLSFCLSLSLVFLSLFPSLLPLPVFLTVIPPSLLRQAELVRVRVGESRALTFWDFVNGVERMPWNAYIKSPAPLPLVSTTCIRSKLWHNKAVSERVVTALVNRRICRFEDAPEAVQKYTDLTVRPPQDKPVAPPSSLRNAGPGHKGRHAKPWERRHQQKRGGDEWEGAGSVVDGRFVHHRSPRGERAFSMHGPTVAGDPTRVFVRFEDNLATVSVDASGPDLYMRGYRKMVVASPLRETLAAACLHAVASDLGARGIVDASKPLLQSLPLWDPMCGSGTIVLEAATEASGMVPGKGKVFAFENWPTHDGDAYM